MYPYNQQERSGSAFGWFAVLVMALILFICYSEPAQACLIRFIEHDIPPTWEDADAIFSSFLHLLKFN
uniref:Uncharacterized protein n=1 Tax=Roseihalotalea indica TaxID=2867963 RepID=A0AA49GGS1_9BACT|nr:hypothetical protein K4G66_18500 [Tunicatimonas sp. TK19036]